MKTVKINIFEKEFEAKLSLRSMLKFNELTGKEITEITNLNEMFLLYYSICIACSKSDFTFDDFIDELDNKPEEINKLNSLLKKGE